MGKFVDQTKYMPRVLDESIKEYLSVCGAILIEGPKWCGKTWTSSYHSKSEFLVGDPANNFSNRMLAELNPTIILNGDTPRMIDEWQEVPSIWDAVRAEVDRRNKKGQIILTGSSTPKEKGILHSGTGRIVSIRMNTMSLYESKDSSGLISLKDICDNKIDDMLLNSVDLKDLAYYIVRGGWPGNLNSPRESATIMPRAYMDNLIKEDLNRLDNETYDKNKMKLLLKSLARNESTTVSNLKIINDVTNNESETISRNTFMKYIETLNRLLVLKNTPPFSPNVRSSLRVKQQEKKHFSDPSMACAMLNLTEEKLMNDLNTFGFMFEALCERDLEIYANSFGGKLYHYQDYLGNEIDSIIELNDGSFVAIEIKLGENKVEEAANNLIKVCNQIEKNGGKKPKAKIVICGLLNAAYRRKDDVIVVPITALKN